MSIKDVGETPTLTSGKRAFERESDADIWGQRRQFSVNRWIEGLGGLALGHIRLATRKGQRAEVGKHSTPNVQGETEIRHS